MIRALTTILNITARELLRFRDSSALRFKTIRKYAIEITEMFKGALDIVPFSKLPVFRGLGGTNNIFYKFFEHLKDNDLLNDDVRTFGEFLKEFKFEQHKPDSYLKSSIEYILSSLRIEIEELFEYNLGSTIDIINQELRRSNRSKSHNATVNDALMFQRLADRSSEINPIEPIFCTWDRTLNDARKAFLDSHPSLTKWFMFTPSRLMDHYAMMNFQIRPGTVSNEVLSILSEDHKQMTQSLLTSMSLIINPENEVGLRHTNKISELRTQTGGDNESKHEFNDEGTKDSTYIDVIINTMVNHYMGESGKLDRLKSLFTKEEFFEPIGTLFSNHIKLMTETGKLDDKLIIQMDLIIDSAR